MDEIAVARITESRGPKSDKRDAYGLAEKLRMGNLDKPVFKAPPLPHEATVLERSPSRFAICRRASRSFVVINAPSEDSTRLVLLAPDVYLSFLAPK